MTKNPCYNCTERTAECHTTCEKYLAWSADRREKIESSWRKRADVTSYTIGKCLDNKEFGIKKRGRKK